MSFFCFMIFYISNAFLTPFSVLLVLFISLFLTEHCTDLETRKDEAIPQHVIC